MGLEPHLIKKMNKKTLQLLILICVLAFSTPAFAQEKLSLPSTSQEAILVATVNIYNSKIVSQDKNIFKLSFDLSNRENIQPDVSYAVQLIQKTENKSDSIIDEKIYEKTNLNENETIKKEITYSAPQYLSGKFDLQLIAKNQTGLSLGISSLGEISLEGKGDYIEIDQSSCRFTKEQPKKDENLSNIFDNKKELIIYCDIENKSQKELSFSPSLKIYANSSFGKLIDEKKETNLISIKSQEKKQIQINLPKIINPQNYLAILELESDNNKISNQASINYQIAGLSASIQNIFLDKNLYQKGETAQVSMYWTAQNTEKEKIFTKITIKDKQNKNCSKESKQELDQTKILIEYTLPITANCQDPKIAVSLEDKDGKILDTKNYELKSVLPKEEKKDTVKTETKNNIFLYGIILIIILILILVLIILKKKHILSLLFLILTGSFLFGGEARGDTLILPGGAIVNYGINKTNFTNGEPIYATFSVSNCPGSWPGCPSEIPDAMVGIARGNSNIFITGCAYNNVYGITNRTCQLSLSDGIADEYYHGQSITVAFAFSNTDGGYQPDFEVARGNIPISIYSCINNNDGASNTEPNTNISGETICPNDNMNLTATFNWQNVGVDSSFCTDARKCEYYVAGSSPPPPPPPGCVPHSPTCNVDTCIGETCWTGCEYIAGTKNCTPPPPVGACGVAAKSYKSTDTNFSGNFCDEGTLHNPSVPVFPDKGATSHWYCGTAYCSASRAWLDIVFSSSPPMIDLGKSSMLLWSTSGAVSCSASSEIGTTWLSRTPIFSSFWRNTLIGVSGSKEIIPTSDGMYSFGITCDDGIGHSVYKTAMLLVYPNCTGTSPDGTNQIICPGDETNVGRIVPGAWHNVGETSASCTATKCEYYTSLSYSCANLNDCSSSENCGRKVSQTCMSSSPYGPVDQSFCNSGAGCPDITCSACPSVPSKGGWKEVAP